MHNKKSITLLESIEQRICFIRGQKVMIDRDLAMLYQVKAIALRQQVKRNRDRFPADFMFQLTKTETQNLVSQNVIPSIKSVGGYLPYAFTQEGVAMLSSVLKSNRAVQVNIAIMRAFVRIRSILAAHKELARKVEALEAKTETNFKEILKLIKKYLKPNKQVAGKIGFRTDRAK